jgi:DNA-directed RNA polymerase specialized sigma24 family protein
MRRDSERPDHLALAQARILCLLVVDGLSYDLIGEEMGCSKWAVGRYVADLVGVFPPLRGAG